MPSGLPLVHLHPTSVVELGGKGELTLRTVPLMPCRDMRRIRGTFAEVTDKAFCEGTAAEDYLHVILTDEEDIPDVLTKLRVIYKNIMKLIMITSALAQ